MNSTLRNTLLAVFRVAWWLPFFVRLAFFVRFPRRREKAVQKAGGVWLRRLRLNLPGSGLYGLR